MEIWLLTLTSPLLIKDCILDRDNSSVFEDKKISEICEITGKRDGTVKSLISRGLDKVRKVFEGK